MQTQTMLSTISKRGIAFLLGFALLATSVLPGFSLLQTTYADEQTPPTELAGSFFEDTTLFLSESPYVVTDDVTLFPDYSLTIEPGVELRFDPEKKLNIRGNLIAEGTSTQPIVFTSNKATPGKSDWGGISIATNLGGRALLQYVTVTYAVYGLYVDCCNEGGPVTIADSIFRENHTAVGGYAGWDIEIYRTLFENNDSTITNADKIIRDCTFLNNKYGLYSTERVSVYDSTFTGHEIALWGGRGTVKGNVITQNNTGIKATYQGFDLSYNTITDNDLGVGLGANNSGSGYMTPALNYNNIYDNATYNVKHTAATSVDASHNYWGTTDVDEIQASIYDGRDDASLGLVTYEPIATDPIIYPVGTLVVSLGEEIPVNTILPGATSVPMLNLEFTAIEADVNLNGITLHRYGVGAPGDFEAVYLYQNDVPLTSGLPISSENNEVTFSNLNITIPKDETITLTAVADFSNNPKIIGNENGLELTHVDKVETNAIDVNGNFPLQGNVFVLASLLSNLTVTMGEEIPGDLVYAGDTNVEMINLVFEVSDYDIQIDGITLHRYGVGSIHDIESVYLYQNGVPLTSGQSIYWQTNEVSFNDLDLDIAEGESITLTAVADFSTNASLGNQNGLELESFDAIDSNATEIHGAYPIRGNIFTIANTSPDLPDLVVEDIQLLNPNTIIAQEEPWLQATVCNRGTATAYAELITTNFFTSTASENNGWDFPDEGLAVDSCNSAPFMPISYLNITENDYYSIIVNVDTENDIFESDETNNSFSRRIYIQVSNNCTPDQLTDNDAWHNRHLANHGNIIAWDGYDSSGSPEIFIYRTNIGHTTPIQLTNNNVADTDPAVYNTKVVWSGYDGSSGYNDPEIYLYDLNSDTTAKITDNYDLSDESPAIFDHYIVWEGYYDSNGTYGDSEIYLYDIDTGITTQITDNGNYDLNPAIYDQYIVWQQGSSSSWSDDSEIFLYNLETQITTQITDNNWSDHQPAIYDHHITWSGNDGNDTEIFLYDINTDNTIQLTNNYGHDEAPTIFNDYLVWYGDYEIYLFNIEAQIITRITHNNGADIDPIVYKSGLVWLGEDENTGNKEVFDLNLNNCNLDGSTVECPVNCICDSEGNVIVCDEPTCSEPTCEGAYQTGEYYANGCPIYACPNSPSGGGGGGGTNPVILPDLVIEKIQIEHQQGKPQITATVCNQGTAPVENASNLYVRFSTHTGKTKANIDDLDDLAVDRCADFTVPASKFKITSGGYYTLNVLADPLNLIQEIDERNNKKRKRAYIYILKIKPKPPVILVCPSNCTCDAKGKTLKCVEPIKIPPAGFEDKVLVNYAAYSNPFPDTNFESLEGKAAAELYRRAVIGGFPDGEFKGSRDVNRAEAAKFLLLAKYKTIEEYVNNDKFPDVKGGEWYVKFIMKAAKLSVISGYPDGFFRPQKGVNTAEFLKMLAKTFELELHLPYSYTDVSEDLWYARYAGISQKYNLFPDREHKLEPAKKLTRSEVAIAIYQFLKNKDLYDSFAQCITQEGWELYGSDTCPFCQIQKEYFGDSIEYIEYIDCQSRIPNSNQAEVCKEKKITGYPTWIGPNDERINGYRSLEDLAEETGCSL